MLNIHQKTNLDPILVDQYFSDPIKRELFEKYEWIPQQPGILSEFIKVPPKNNFYQEHDSMFVLPSLFENRSRNIRNLKRQAKYSFQGQGKKGLLPNLKFYRDKYIATVSSLNAKKLSKSYIKKLKSKNNITQIKKSLESTNRNNFPKKALLAKRLKKAEKNLDYIEFVDKFQSNIITRIQEINLVIKEIETSI